MPRNKWVYNPENPEPYELSRSQIEAYIKCPACFWMRRVKNIKFPGMPGFLLNTATDTLLKKDFDKYRMKQVPHPVMEQNGLGHLVPYSHENFELWTKSLQLGLRNVHEPTNMIIGGGLDDVWHDKKNDELFVVDYKSTASKKNEESTALEKISLVGAYKEGFKRQMDIYQWILRENGFNVSKKGYFLYVNGDQHFEPGMLFEDGNKGKMIFDVQIIEYESNDEWVENILFDIKKCLDQEECPPHSDSGFGPKGDKQCEYSALFDGMKRNNLTL
jgi:hypothetical protein|tara:strand:- start:739 stop:1560 length:822 start_codon:yes stop_codon:yes gene_type:complete